MRWLAFLLLAGLIVLAVWFGARWLVVFPLLGWALVNYAALDLFGLLDERGQAWRAYASQAWDALLSGRMSSIDLEWGAHLHPLHREVSDRIVWLWLPVLGAATLFILFRSRGAGFRRRFLLTGQRKAPVFRLAGMRLKNGLLRGLAKAMTTLTLTRRLLVSERKEWQSAGPSFLGYQSAQWRTSGVATRFQPDGSNIPAPSMTPAEWVLRHVKPSNGARRLAREEFVSACVKAMMPQLGVPWDGLRKAPPHAQALAALAYVNRYRGEEASRTLANRLASIYLSSPRGAKRDRVFLAAAREVFADAKALARVEKWARNHAWTNTAMIAIYAKGGPFQEWGGGDAGVLPTASFLWLKDVDRPLWYALNNVGRRAYHVEGAGAVCHFFHERVADQPLEEPRFEEAILGGGERDTGGRIHGIFGYLLDNGMIADKESLVVDFALIEAVLKRGED